LAAQSGDGVPATLDPDATADAVARGNQLMLPALIHDLNAARNETIQVAAALSDDRRFAVERALTGAVAEAIRRINANAELLGLR
jgi:hypothetical protein